MKVVMLMAVVICVLVSGCFESNNVSLFGNPESDGVFGVRGSTEVMQSLEVGASANYMDGDTTTTTTYYNRRRKKSFTKTRHEKGDNWTWGIHSIYTLEEIAEGLSPYIGMQANIGEGGDDVFKTLEPLGGLRLKVSDSVSLLVEYQRQSLHGEDNKVVGGILIGF